MKYREEMLFEKPVADKEERSETLAKAAEQQIETLAKAADNGNIYAYIQLADISMRGGLNFPKNLDAAQVYIEQAVEFWRALPDGDEKVYVGIIIQESTKQLANEKRAEAQQLADEGKAEAHPGGAAPLSSFSLSAAPAVTLFKPEGQLKNQAPAQVQAQTADAIVFPH